MGKKGGRKQKRGKTAPAQDAPPTDNAAESTVETHDDIEVGHDNNNCRLTFSQTPNQPGPPSLSTSAPLTDEPSRPSSPPAADVSESIVNPDAPAEAEERADDAASPTEGADIATGLSAVNLESQDGDIGMPQEEVVPVEASVHSVEPEELEPEGGESVPASSHQDEPQSGDLGEAAEQANEPTTSDSKHEASLDSFKSVDIDTSEHAEAAIPAPLVESTSTHTNPDEFEEVDIGADQEHSPPPAAAPSETAQPEGPASTETPSSARADSPADETTVTAGDTHNEDHPVEQASTSTESERPDTAAAAEQPTDLHPISTSDETEISDSSQHAAVPDVHIDAGTPVSADSKTPTALGPPFEESTSIASRRQLPPLSVAPGSNPSTPGEAPQISPMIRSTSMSSSRVGIISPRSAKGSPRVLMSPKFRSIDATHTDDEYDDDDGMEDMPMESVPFESIPLDGETEVKKGLSRQTSLGSSHSRNVSRDSNLPPPAARTSLASNGHARVDSRGVPIVSERPRTPVSRAASAAASAAATPRESPGASSAPAAPSPTGSPQVNPIPANANQQPTQALGVKGVNAFEKFVSRTRPAHLPPKDKSEDQAHLHEWENMMAQARQHDAEERKKQAARQAARERRLLEVTPRWENMLNAKDFSPAKIRHDPAKRKLWFEGCPPRLRGKAWQLAIGNPLTMHKGELRW